MKNWKWSFKWRSRFDLLFALYIGHLIEKYHPELTTDNMLRAAVVIFFIIGINIRGKRND